MSSTKLDDLKADINSIANNLRETEKEVYTRINQSDKNLVEVNTMLQALLTKLNEFMETFKNHDNNEMVKYSNIENMFSKVQKETKDLEVKIGETYATKDELKYLLKGLEENKTAINKGFKVFYIGSGIVLAIGVFGTVIVWLLDIIASLKGMK